VDSVYPTLVDTVYGCHGMPRRPACRIARMPDSLRERLVDTGVELLERDGVGGLGLRAIARAAGVSHGAPRRWFPTHAALLAAIAARGFGDLIGRFAQSAT